MSNVPYARERLQELIDDLRSALPPNPIVTARDIHNIMTECLYRERPVRKKTPAKSRPMTAKLAREIRAHAKGHPKVSVQQIANHFKVNIGRASAAIARKW